MRVFLEDNDLIDKYKSIYSDLGFVNSFDINTRVTLQSANRIDHLLFWCTCDPCNNPVVLDAKITDHFATGLVISLKKINTPPPT